MRLFLLYENYQHAGWFAERLDYLKKKYPTTVGPFGSKNFAYRWAKGILKNAWFGSGGIMSYALKSGSNKRGGGQEVGYIEVHSTAHRINPNEGEIYLHLSPKYEYMANIGITNTMRPKGWVDPDHHTTTKPKKIRGNKSKDKKTKAKLEGLREQQKLYREIKNLWKDGWRHEEIAELLDADPKIVKQIVGRLESEG